MKKTITCFFIILQCALTAQHIQVVSAKDSLRIPFVSLLIKNDRINYSKTSNDDGVIVLNQKLDDTVSYSLTIHSFGFQKYTRKLKGSDINALHKVYLLPSDIKLDEVVITAQYEPTAADQAIQKIRIIDKEKIQQMGAVNLRDVLTNQLNVRLQQDNVLGSSMSLQGVSGENVKILVDGVPVIGRQNGNIDLSQINMNNVERIEFIEGPLSVQYGTNALAGTINIITKRSLTKKITAGVTSYYESIGTYNLTGDVTFSQKKNSLQVSGGRNYFDGWNSSDAPFKISKSHLADSTRFQQWKPKEQYFASAAYQYSFKKIDVGVKSAYFDESIINRGYPRAPYAESTFDDHYYTKRLDNSVFLKGRLSPNWSVNALTAYNYYNRVKRTVYKDLTTLDETLSANSSDQDTSRFTQLMTRASFIHSVQNSKINYELGYDANYQSAFGKRIENQVQYMGDYAAFITSEYKTIPRLVIKPGLRYAYNTVYKTPLIPSLNVKWNLSDNHTLRASYARGFRAPDLKELYFLFVDINHNIIGNSSLKAEQSDNFSVSYNYNRDIKKCRVKFDASAFYNSIFNMITLAQVTGTEYSYINVGRFKTQGFQLGNTLNFKRLIIQTGFNYTGRYNDPAISAHLPEYSYSPEVLANATYKLIRSKTSIAVFYKYNGRLPGYALTESQVTRTFISAYQLMDATVSQFFWKDKINITIGCKNIFDVKNIGTSLSTGGVHSSASTSVPFSTGRNYFIKLAFNFSKV